MGRENVAAELSGTSSAARVIALAEDVSIRTAAPQAETVDKHAAWPGGSICALGHVGLLGLHVPRRLGGLGEGISSVARVTEVLGQARSSTAMCFGMHCVATAVIAAKATPVQEESCLRPIAAGHHVTSFALSEPGSGAHFFLPRATFRREAAGFVVDGDEELHHQWGLRRFLRGLDGGPRCRACTCPGALTASTWQGRQTSAGHTSRS